jgi:hypothetical protein
MPSTTLGRHRWPAPDDATMLRSPVLGEYENVCPHARAAEVARDREALRRADLP